MYAQAMTAAPEPLSRLAEYVERRIAELALEYAEVCRRAGISDETLANIRKGASARASTYRKLEQALQWEQGSIAAILAGREPTPLETRSAEERPSQESAPQREPGLSPSEALRRVVRSSARELGVTADDLDEVFRAVRQDLNETTSGRTDLSDMVRAGRIEAGLSLQEVAARAVDPASGDHVVDAAWLDRLERAALDPSEYPEYPQIDALADALHLDPGLAQEAAGAQFMDVHTIWSEDGQVRGFGIGELGPEDQQKALRLMEMYRRVPKRNG